MTAEPRRRLTIFAAGQHEEEPKPLQQMKRLVIGSAKVEERDGQNENSELHFHFSSSAEVEQRVIALDSSSDESSEHPKNTERPILAVKQESAESEANDMLMLGGSGCSGAAKYGVRIPPTLGNQCGQGEEVPRLTTWEDFRCLDLHADHECRPLWTCPTGRIILEAFHPRAAQVSDFLITVAEPASRPELVHEYQVTILSLNAAVSNGLDVEQILALLLRLSKNKLSDDFVSFVREHGLCIGKLKMVLRSNRHFLQATEPALLERLLADPEIDCSVVHDAAVGSAGAPQPALLQVEINSSRVEAVKSAAHKLGLPLLQEYEYMQDRTDENPELEALIRPNVNLRPYQTLALSKMFSADGVARSGMIVLPCGAGKTLVGIAACCRMRRRALILTTTSVAADQWRRQFQQYTSISPEDVYMLTAEQKRPIVDAAKHACVLVTTYSMMGFTGKRSGDTELLLNQIQQLEWGLLVVDEVQVMPARTFRTVATSVKAHCSLGLTATLVREDNLHLDLHWLIGPKLYEASWQQLQDEGYLAKVRCVEVWCEMAKPFFAEYLRAQDEHNHATQRALWTCNPTKLNVCEYLIRFHEQRGDKTIVFSDNVYILEDFAKRLGRYFICGKVDMRERVQILSAFQDSASCNTIFLSKVGDAAIDIPNASVIIQISAHYGSRRQEAQRLGRILRQKSRGFEAPNRYNAFFYSLVSRDTQEMYYANRRQQFLVEQGYNYHVLRDHNVDRMSNQSLVYSSEEAQLQLLKQVLEGARRGGVVEEEDDEQVLPQDTVLELPASFKRPKPEKNLKTEHMEERVDIASLSGGLDGSYAVTSTSSRKRLKASDTC